MPPKLRRDTKLESDGAEFLVLWRMLIERIATYKSYVNYPGYDLLAVQPDRSGVARIQVKSRFRTDWAGFIIGNFDCDFVVFVALNRGFDRPKRDGAKGTLEPHFYVLPVDYVLSVRDPKNKWGKIVRSRLKEIETYRDQWHLISTFLNGGSKPNTSLDRGRER
jgi:hypothetical protein